MGCGSTKAGAVRERAMLARAVVVVVVVVVVAMGTWGGVGGEGWMRCGLLRWIYIQQGRAGEGW